MYTDKPTMTLLCSELKYCGVLGPWALGLSRGMEGTCHTWADNSRKAVAQGYNSGPRV